MHNPLKVIYDKMINLLLHASNLFLFIWLVNMFCYTIWELVLSDHDLFSKCCIQKFQIVLYNTFSYC